jgi:Family of unknown function (DUF6527)
MERNTPRFGHEPVVMTQVARANVDLLDKAGEFAWADENGKRYIMIALPQPTPENPDNYIINYIPVIFGSNISGKSWGWDGNEDKPTLTPSIHCVGHWHGWVRAGILVEA